MGLSLVLNTRDALDNFNGENQRRKILDQNAVIEKIVTMFEDEDGVDACKAIINGAEILIADLEQDDRTLKVYTKVNSDLQVFLVIAQTAEECRKITDSMNEQLETVLKVD